VVQAAKDTAFDVPGELESTLHAAVCAGNGEFGARPGPVDEGSRPGRCEVEREGAVKVEVELPLCEMRRPRAATGTTRSPGRTALNLAKVEHVRMRHLLPGRLLSVQQNGEVMRMVHGTTNHPGISRPVLAALDVIRDHDERPHRVEVDPFPLALGGLKADVVSELEHHVGRAAHGLELPGELGHVDDALALRCPGYEGDDGGVVGSGFVAGAPEHLLVVAEGDICFCIVAL